MMNIHQIKKMQWLTTRKQYQHDIKLIQEHNQQLTNDIDMWKKRTEALAKICEDMKLGIDHLK